MSICVGRGRWPAGDADLFEDVADQAFAALQAPEFRQRIEASIGTLVSIENAATLEARIRRESAAWAKLIKAAKVDLQ